MLHQTVADDTEPPVISNCPDDVTVRVAPDTTTGVASWIEPAATDNSGMAPIVTQSHRPGDSFNIGTTTVTYTFRDGIGNEAVCSFVVTVREYQLYY